MNTHKNIWIMQRISALILIPLSFWFILNCLSFSSMQYFEIIIFFNSTLNSLLFITMMVVMLIHAKLGCDNIIEDYFSEKKIKYISKKIVNILVYLSIFFSVLAVIKIYLY